ncbi:MAG: class III extradiol ring-cleavage dioxygenase [Thermoanaerobaculia bacterium]
MANELEEANRSDRWSPPAPTLFISHGAPSVILDDPEFVAALRGFASRLPKPRAVILMSAHWESDTSVRLTARDPSKTIHDFGGFDRQLYSLHYPAPGDPELSRRIVSILEDASIDAAVDDSRGLDHGAWIPLLMLYPDADVPVIELSLPRPRSVDLVRRIGRALAPLRDEGMMLIGSGGVVHNLSEIRFSSHPAVSEWARRFDDWVWRCIRTRDFDELGQYRNAAPTADLAVPTTEHFDPIFFTVGTSRDEEQEMLIFEGFRFGNLSMRSFAFQAPKM